MKQCFKIKVFTVNYFILHISTYYTIIIFLCYIIIIFCFILFYFFCFYLFLFFFWKLWSPLFWAYTPSWYPDLEMCFSGCRSPLSVSRKSILSLSCSNVHGLTDRLRFGNKLTNEEFINHINKHDIVILALYILGIGRDAWSGRRGVTLDWIRRRARALP